MTLPPGPDRTIHTNQPPHWWFIASTLTIAIAAGLVYAWLA